MSKTICWNVVHSYLWLVSTFFKIYFPQFFIQKRLSCVGSNLVGFYHKFENIFLYILENFPNHFSRFCQKIVTGQIWSEPILSKNFSRWSYCNSSIRQQVSSVKKKILIVLNCFENRYRKHWHLIRTSHQPLMNLIFCLRFFFSKTLVINDNQW